MTLSTNSEVAATSPALDVLLDRAVALFTRFTVQQTREAYDALALYVAYTHAAEVFDFAPRLLLTSAEKRSGKTRTMEIVSKLSFRPLIAANATVPALFRSLQDIRTICLDEADTIFGTKTKAEQNEDLRGLLNAGFQRGTPVLRTVGPNHEPTEFPTFAPAVLAAIGQLPDTVTDRAVNIRLRRRKSSEQVDQYRARRNDPELADLQQQLTEAVTALHEQLRTAEPETPLEDRAADLWEPILAVSDAAGPVWAKRARRAAIALTTSAGEDDSESEGLELLQDCQNLWADVIRADFVKSASLLSHLQSLEDSRWRDSLTGRHLADMLRPYGIRPGHDSTKRNRGYKRVHFEDAFDRYLSTMTAEPSEPSASQ